jgi:hypothetical protein
VSVGTLVETFLVRRTDRPERYQVTDWPSFLERKPYFEYQLGPPSAPPRALVLPAETGGRPLEVWWPAPDGRWSEHRRVQWTPERRPGPKGAAIPLDRIPQWDPVRTPRVRIIVRSPGEVTLGAPRLVR